MRTPPSSRRASGGFQHVLLALVLMLGLAAIAPSYANASANAAGPSDSTGTTAKSVANCAKDGKYLAQYYRGRHFKGKPVKQRCEKRVDATYERGESPQGVNVGPNNFSVKWTTIDKTRARRYDFRAVADNSIAIRVDGRTIESAFTPGEYVSDVRSLRKGKHTIQFRYTKKRGAGYVKGEYVKAPDKEAPRTPRSLDTTPGDGSVALHWKGSDEVDLRGYLVYRNGKLKDEVKSTTFTDAKAKNGKEYTYRVRSVDYRGNRSGKSNKAEETPTDKTDPAVPTGLDVTEGDRTVELTWEEDNESDSYKIYRSDSVDGPYHLISGASPVDGPPYEDTELTNGTTYWYRVQAIDEAGNKSKRSAPVEAQPFDGIAPNKPEALTATEIAGPTVVLEWEHAPEADFDHYEVFRDTDPNVDETDEQISPTGLKDSTLQDTDVEVDETYYYIVRAVDDDGIASDPSDIASITVGDQEAPQAPTGLAASAGDGVVDLGWTASTSPDVNGYRVYRATSPEVDIVPANLIDGIGNITTYHDAEVENDTTYYYAVVAVDQAGNASPSSAVASATPTDTTAPAAPTGLIATAGDGLVELAWDGSTAPDVAGYRVYRGDTADVPTGPGATPVSGDALLTTPAYTDTDVANDSTYFYVVVAVDGHGNASDPSSAASATPTDTTPPGAPTGLTATAGNAQVSLDWDDSTDTDFDHFAVYRATEVNAVLDGEPIAEVDSSEYVDAEVDNGTTYYYAIVAVDSHDNESPASDIVDATPVDEDAPAAPTGLTATPSDTAIDLAWDANTESDLAGYNVFRAEVAEVPTDGDPLNDELLTDAGFTDDSATPGTQYFYVVVAVDDDGNASEPSAAVNATIEVAPQVHEKFSFTTSADTQVPAGYTKNDGSAWTDAAGLGWVEEDSLDQAEHTPLDLTKNTRVRNARAGVSELQRRLIHLHYGDIVPASDNGTTTPGAFELAVPDGWYQVTVSVGDQPGGAKAGCPAPCYDSVHRVNVEGQTAIADFQATSTDEFDEATEVVEVTDGRLTVDSVGGNNTKINYLEVDSTDEPAEPDVHHKVRFADEASVPPAGYLKDFGEAYGERTGEDQGAGLSYGWLELGTDDPVSLVGNGRNRLAPPAQAPAGTPELRAGLMHMQLPENASNGVDTPGYWELAVPDGTYDVEVSVGDAGTATDSEHWINLEGQNAIAAFVPTGGAGSDTHHATAERTVTVSDGRVTVSPESGTNTKINWVTIDSVPGSSDRPSVLETTPANLATDVDPETATVVGDLDLVGGGVEPNSLNGDSVRLTKVSDGSAVDGTAYTSGGADTIGFAPTDGLEENTLYRFEVTDGVEDVDGNAFLPYSMVFETGDASGGGGPIAFDKSDSGAAKGGQYTSVVKGPDGKLYAGSITGEIYRFDIESDGTLSNRQTITTVKEYSNSAASGDTYRKGFRTVIGLAFDPASTAENPILWISDNAPYLGTSNVPDFTGRIAKLTGPDLETYTAVLDGLPRSVKDHETNSLAFGPDGALYFNQGANNAMGAPDGAWANREEQLLSAAVLRLDRSKLPGNLPVNVRTGSAGSYDPFAPDAPLTVYASGVRNAYDLVWHSNGHLYVPTNGSAAGGNVPEVPDDLPAVCSKRPDGGYTGPPVDAVQDNPQETDYVFDVKPGQYYGHPNPSRCEYVLNNGNPTSGVDPFENSKYPIGTQPDPNYALSDVYDAGLHASANGAIEYQGGAFGGALDGKLLYVRYSQGQDIVTFDVAANGKLSNRQVGHTGFTGFNQPLDLTEDVATGNIYVTELSGDSGIVLLKPQGGGGGPVPDATERLVFSGPTGSTSDPLDAVVQNDGSEDLVVTGATLGGENPGQFALGTSTFPQTVEPGGSIEVPVEFAPTSVGVKSADLNLATNAGPRTVRLRGLAAAGLGGSSEPSLQRIMDTLEIPIDVGDPDPSNASMPSTQGMIGDEVPAQLFKKAAFDAPISITPVAAYGPQDDDPAIHVGWHEAGSASGLHEQFDVSAADAQGLMIDPDGETTNIDPGEDAVFGFYSSWPSFDDRVAYTEDALNTWDSALPHHVRVYPYENRDGTVEPNTYVVATEEVPGSAFDGQDIVLVVTNVEPYVPEAADAVLETTNLDGVPYDDRLAFSRIQNPADGDQKTHDVATVRISNTGTESMQVTDLSIVGNFELVDGPAVPFDVPAGGHEDVSVRFTATGGDVNTGALNITSNAGTNGNESVALAGFWQSQSEGGQEPSVAEMAQVFGYTTNIPANLNGDGYVEAVGDEVLSPYWRQADEGSPVRVRQLAAYHSYPNGATVKWFEQDSDTQHNLSGINGRYAQSILPPRNSGEWPVSFSPSDDVFGFMVDGESSDDAKNNQSTDETNGCPGPCGHHVRFFPVEDREGDVVENTYLMIMDYSGINYDYNDNVYLIENITPEKLLKPQGVSALAEDGKVTLTWSPTGQEGVQYRVWRDTDPDVPADAAHLVSGADALTEPEFVDESVTNGTTYYYVVRAVIPGESNSDSTEPVAATPNAAGAFVEKVNFQNASAPVPSGYVRDFGQSYGPRTDADQGSGLSYGWIAEDGGQPVDLSVGGTTGPGNGRDRNVADDQRLDTLMHMQGDDVPNFNGTPIAGMWELAVPDGTYAVTVAAGDPNNNSDPEIHTINVEGVNAIDHFVPSGAPGSASHHDTKTVEVTVDDGRLTIDALGGTNTKINYVDIAATN